MKVIQIVGFVGIFLAAVVIAFGIFQANAELRQSAEALVQMEENLEKCRQHLAWIVISPDPEGTRPANAVAELYRDGSSFEKIRLVGAVLEGAHLEGANFDCACLFKVDFRGAYLNGANLVGANLKCSLLIDASLEDVDLRFAELQEANLTNANLSGADVRGVKAHSAKGLTAHQVLSTKDWRGAVLPPDLQTLRLPLTASEGKLDSLRRTWTP